MGQGNGNAAGISLAVELPRGFVEAIADAVAARLGVAPHSSHPDSPYLDVDEAAAYIRASSKQRLYDLSSAGAIAPRRDGRRLLFHRDDLDAYLRGPER
jgi:excisionase family DNA binding protein